ncbi:MAG: cytochrome c [Ferruginibacter sp.]
MKILFIVMIFLIAGCTGNDKTPVNNADTPVISSGEILFKNNCASCHKIDKDFAAPALKGALIRWEGDKKNMYDFIRNSSESENAYAKALKNKWAPVIMTSFSLSDAQIDSIMNYCENHVQPKAVPVAVP